jgi:chromosome segregation ATPase
MSTQGLYQYFLLLAVTDPATALDAQALVSLVTTAVISASVFTALITGIIQYLINRRNSRITERKNSVEAESSLVTRYKEAAAEERTQKESAVETIKNLLGIAESQVDSLKSTILTLNTTIEIMTKMANAQQDIIDQLTSDRDRTKNALELAVAQIDKQKELLVKHQKEIEALAAPIEKARLGLPEA